jgi:hypothetical protein
MCVVAKHCFYCLWQGTLTEREGYVQLASYLVKKVNKMFNM